MTSKANDDAAPRNNLAEEVGVIVVTYNSKAHWARFVEAVEGQTVKVSNLIVIDNASRPEERLANGDIPNGWRLIQLDANIGFAAANNLAAKMLPTEFIALINPDAFAEPNWLENLLSAAVRFPAIDAFGSTQVRAGASHLYDGLGDSYWAGGHPFRTGYDRSSHRPAVFGETFSACGAAVMYRRSKFIELGGFDETFFPTWRMSIWGFVSDFLAAARYK